MFKQTLQRGFTLIELLVVIAIIGILAAVVLASLNDARSSGADARTKQQLSSLRSQAELTYTTAGDYATVCDNVGALDDNLTSFSCVDGTSAWAASADLVATGEGFWCVDSTGKSDEQAAAETTTACD